MQLLGFDAPPLCIIWWQKNGADHSKTVCFTEKDKQAALKRFSTDGDFYNVTYDAYEVNYGEGQKVKFALEEQKNRKDAS